MTDLKMVERGLHGTLLQVPNPLFPFLLPLSSHTAGLLMLKEVEGM